MEKVLKHSEEGMAVNCPTCGREYLLDKWSVLEYVDRLRRWEQEIPELDDQLA